LIGRTIELHDRGHSLWLDEISRAMLSRSPEKSLLAVVRAAA